jgi:hypothetical protein
LVGPPELNADAKLSVKVIESLRGIASMSAVFSRRESLVFGRNEIAARAE